MPNYLTTSSTIECPHRGKATLLTANTQVRVKGVPVLLESDIHSVVGCSHTLPGGKYSPCVCIEWSNGSTKTTVNSTAPLLKNSTGTCYNAEKLIQGVATIVDPKQMKASAQ